MTSTHVAPNVCHDSILWHLRDVERIVPKHGAHLSSVAASPLTNPLPEPWESFLSNETGFPACFEGFSLLLLPPPHLLSAPDDVEESCTIVTDLHMHHTIV